jgi:hypothetical protein
MRVQWRVRHAICCVLLLGMMISVVVAQQKTSARLVIDHKGFMYPQRRGFPLSIEATITSPAGVRKAEVMCRASGGREFTALEMVPRGDNVYRAIVPDWMTTGEVLEYYITATDQLGHSTSQGFVGFPLSVRLVSVQRRTQKERLKELQETLDLIRKSREVQDPEGYGNPNLDRSR